MDTSLNGWALFSSVIQAKAPTTLAPGSMALIGLLGLAYREFAEYRPWKTWAQFDKRLANTWTPGKRPESGAMS